MRMFRVWRMVVLVSLFVLSACGATTAVAPTPTVVIAPATETPVAVVQATVAATETPVPATETAIVAPTVTAPGMESNPASLAAVQTILDY